MSWTLALNVFQKLLVLISKLFVPLTEIHTDMLISLLSSVSLLIGRNK